MKRKVSAILFVACGLAIGLVFNGVFSTPTPPQTAAAENHTQTMSKEELGQLSNLAGSLEKLFHYAAGQVDPAVVSIQSTQVIRGVMPQNPFGDMFPGFPGFPGRGNNQGGRQFEQRREGLGSGIIIDKEGHILTNNHVIAGAQQLTVKLADGRTFAGEVVGADEKTDLAVIRMKTDEKDFPTVQLGDSSKLEVGEWVLAVGSPFGLTQTVSAGIVSATGRTGIGTADYESMIQTDAAINPGNSGGPLINLHGQVVGINTAIVSQSGGNVGIGFAIPINMAKDILPDLMAGRKVVRGWLGIEISNLTPELSEGFGYRGTEGVLVNEVMPGTPAEKAGLKAGDIITEYDGKKVTDMQELRRVVAMTKPDTKVKLTVWREGKNETLGVTIGNQASSAIGTNWLGISVKDLTPDQSARMGLSNLHGVVVSAVKPDSPAAGENVTAGLVVVSVNRQPVSNANEFARRVQAVRPGGVLLLRLIDPKTQERMWLPIRRPAG